MQLPHLIVLPSSHYSSLTYMCISSSTFLKLPTQMSINCLVTLTTATFFSASSPLSTIQVFKNPLPSYSIQAKTKTAISPPLTSNFPLLPDFSFYNQIYCNTLRIPTNLKSIIIIFLGTML